MSVPAPCSILTNAIFDTLAPTASDPPYSHAAFCAAVDAWNAENPNNPIFSGSTELERRNELAAFVGHALHESGDFRHSRETSQCESTVEQGGKVYCAPGYWESGARSDHYCSAQHTRSSSPSGCDCPGPVANEVGAGYDASELFFGRGPVRQRRVRIQLPI